MPRFEKTSIHYGTAVLLLLGLYALGGLVYAVVVHSDESVTIWAVVAALAIAAALAFQAYIRRKRRTS